MNIGTALIVFVFGVMGFGINLLFRIIFLYEDWQQGNKINWWLQAFITFGVPATCMFAIVEVLAVLGFFTQPAVFTF